MERIDIQPSTMPAEEIKEAIPVGALAQVAIQHKDGIDSDTMVVNPEWLAMLFKQIREGSSDNIGLQGCLLAGSPELNRQNDHLQSTNCINPTDWENWLKGKPEETQEECALTPEGEGTL